MAALFFVVMNILLVRSEFGGRNELKSSVSPEMVFQKILTSPDQSFLEIRHHGKKSGSGRWAPGIAQSQLKAKELPEDLPPEGMLEEVLGYTLDFSGSLTPAEGE